MKTMFRRFGVVLAALSWLVALPQFAQAQGVDVVARGLAANAAPAISILGGQARIVTPPAAFASSMAGIDLGTITIRDFPDRSVAELSKTPEQVFAQFNPTLLTAPGASYYVNRIDGSDGDDCLSWALACVSINAAITKCNAAAATSCEFYIRGGKNLSALPVVYDRSTGFVSATGTVCATKDAAYWADGGPVTVTTTDAAFAPTVDGTYTNLYASSGLVSQVTDVVGAPDRFNHYPRFVNMTAAVCNATVGVNCFVPGATTYLRRADGAAPTTANTRAYREETSRAFYHCSNTNAYFGSKDGSTFYFEGGSKAGVSGGGGASVVISPTSLGSTKHVVVLTNVSGRYGEKGIFADNFHGYVVTYGMDAGATTTDGSANIHNTLFSSAADSVMIVVNSSGYDMGVKGYQSANCLTAHENTKLIVLGGWCELSGAGTFRSIQDSVNWVVGMTLKYDRGDSYGGGLIYPTLAQLDQNAVAYFDGVRLIGDNATIGFHDNTTAGSNFHVRNMPSTSLRNIGTIIPY